MKVLTGFAIGCRRGKIASMTIAHPRLSRPPLVEAVFEIRFSTDMAYGLFPGRLFDQLDDLFPEVEELQAAGLPPDIPFPAIVRHRFKSMDGSKLFQTGHGVLSVNHVAYSQYGAFRDDVQRVIEAVKSLEAVKEVRRLGLRYINQMVLDREWSTITTLTDRVPEGVSSKIHSRRFQYGLDFEPDRMNLGLGSVDKNGESRLQLDLDFFREGEALPVLEPQVVLEWLDMAHEHIYEVFSSSLTQEYMKEIR